MNAEKCLKELEKEITCSVCQEHYTHPKVLPCLHYYCKQCILMLALKNGKDKAFSCPECRKETTLPEGNADNLQTAFFVNRFQVLYNKQEKALCKEEVNCEICTTSQVKAEAFCRQCGKFACEKCIQSHHMKKTFFEGHEIISLDEVKKVHDKKILTKIPPAKMCQLHDELLKMFCFDCNCLICLECAVKDHKHHNFEFNNIAAANKRKELLESLKPLRDVVACQSLTVEEIHTTLHELAVQEESVAFKIETSFKENRAVCRAL